MEKPPPHYSPVRWLSLKEMAAKYPLVTVKPPPGVEVVGVDLTNGKDAEPVRFVVIGSTTEEEWHADGRTEMRKRHPDGTVEYYGGPAGGSMED